MEHPCKRCGAAVEDGTPFCRQCGAPQIRVAVWSDEPATEPAPTDLQEEAQQGTDSQSSEQGRTPERRTPPAVVSAPIAAPPKANAFDRRAVIIAALSAGFAAGLGTLVPFVPFISLCMIAAGGLAITLYKRRAPYVAVAPGRGFRIGALAGLFGFLLNAITTTLGMLSATNRAALRAEMQERLKQALEANSEPAAQQMMKQIGDAISTPGGLAVLFALSISLFGLMFVLLGGVGGWIGATLFGKKVHE